MPLVRGISWLVLTCAVAVGATTAAPVDLSRQFSHRIWRVQDGLPQNRIQAITQTPDGYLWIGTSEGLVRFDGARFFLFDRSNTPAFHDDSIRALCPAHDGGIWVGTESGGLLYYRNGAFQALGVQDGITNGFV